jgi:hypothetical protein
MKRYRLVAHHLDLQSRLGQKVLQDGLQELARL